MDAGGWGALPLPGSPAVWLVCCEQMPAFSVAKMTQAEVHPNRKNCHLASSGGLLAPLAVRGWEGDQFAESRVISLTSEQVLRWGEVEVVLAASGDLAWFVHWTPTLGNQWGWEEGRQSREERHLPMPRVSSERGLGCLVENSLHLCVGPSGLWGLELCRVAGNVFASPSLSLSFSFAKPLHWVFSPPLFRKKS